MNKEKENKMYLIMQALVSIMLFCEIILAAIRCRFDDALAWTVSFLLFLILIGRENQSSNKENDKDNDNS